jgi:hypothetical protein
LSEEKHARGPAEASFEYLGYRLSLPKVSVKSGNVRRLVDSIAAHFARYHHEADARFRETWLDADAKKRLLLDELNEKVTGAVNENRRYGWLFYFIEINDLDLLYQLDDIVRNLWKRFVGHPIPPELKKFSRAYYEARYNQRGGYIHNYNRYDTLSAKLRFLVGRGYLDPKSQARYKDEQIEQIFRKVKYRSLARLEADVGTIS